MRSGWCLSLQNGKKVWLLSVIVFTHFRSLALAQKERAIGVILSGTMSDGTMGLKDIKEHGGLVIAQAPETAQHDGMPQSAINTGMVDLVLPIEKMPEAILKFIAHPYIHGETRLRDEDGLNQVLAVIHTRCNHDFRCYKRNKLRFKGNSLNEMNLSK